VRLKGLAEVVLEDGTRLAAPDAIPPEVPAGYHTLHLREGNPRRLIIAPARCHLPADLRTFALAAQLYALHSRSSWGIGDLADVRDLGRWVSQLGAGLLMVSPLHAPLPTTPQQPSPYSPSSRRYRSPLALRIEEIPGAEHLAHVIDPLARRGRALSRAPLIDRDAVWALKREALTRLHDAFGGDPDFDAYLTEQGAALQRFCVHSALVELLSDDWHRWPEPLRRPGSSAVASFAEREAPRVRRHAFAQWQIDRQLAAAGAQVGLIQDLAVGADARGADAWADQDAMAFGVRIGAPPDAFNPEGQDWGLPPFHPWRLLDAGCEPMAAAIRSGMRHGAALRLDHVMGLFRLWWIPPGAEPHQGGYVSYSARTLLAVLAVESARAGAFVVGEDLGTVEPGIRAALTEHNVLSYRVLWFEDRPPSAYPEQSLAAITTHDLPTIAGVWSGDDAGALRERILSVPGVTPQSRPDTVVRALHTAIARSPSRVVCGTLEDLLLVRERPNMPGTVDTWPNWRRPLPMRLERLTTDAAVRRRADALHRPQPAVPTNIGTRSG
jgi:4-alpha-glucanotransferase